MSVQGQLFATVDPVLGPVVYDEPPASAVMYRVGGRYYPMRHDAKCRVCQSCERVQIENALLAGHGYTAIARAVPAEEMITPALIKKHRDRHLPLDLAVRHGLIDERAKELGLALEQAAGTVVDQVTLARAVVQRAFARLASGEVEPSLADGLAAAKLLTAMQVDEGELDQEAMVRILSAYMEAVGGVVSGEQLARIGARMRANPALALLAGRAQTIDVEEPTP